MGVGDKDLAGEMFRMGVVMGGWAVWRYLGEIEGQVRKRDADSYHRCHWAHEVDAPV